MSKEEILKTLNDKKIGEDGKTLLELCRTPKTGGEIMRCKTKRDAFEILIQLKAQTAIAFEAGKYYTTRLGIEILDSFPR
jgi:hypothetical protein